MCGSLMDYGRVRCRWQPQVRDVGTCPGAGRYGALILSGRPRARTGRGRREAWKSVWAIAVVLAAAAALAAAVWSIPAAPRPLCGQITAARPALRHVIIVMLENRSYSQVVGSPAAPFQTRLAGECGNATEAFAAT